MPTASTERTSSMRPSSPARATSGASIAGTPFDRMASRRGRSSERGADVGEGVELEVGLHEPVGVGVAERQPERLAGRGEPVAGHGREVAVAAHQAPLPGVLELPGAPELAERWAVAGPD